MEKLRRTQLRGRTVMRFTISMLDPGTPVHV